MHLTSEIHDTSSWPVIALVPGPGPDPLTFHIISCISVLYFLTLQDQDARLRLIF